jgi:molybdate transport system substrate-binding protein
MKRHRILIAATVAATLALAGCTGASDGPGEEDGGTGTPLPDVSGTITVFAAASLSETFELLATEFEQRHPSAEVVLNFGGSAGLAAQVIDGGPADVLATADEPTMEKAVDSGAATTPVIFTSNTLEIAVPAGNPAGVDQLADFADESLAIALCDPSVPCGSAAQVLFDTFGITPSPDTLEPDVKSVLTKVELGEVDAGLVYVTDVIAGGDAVEGVEVPEALSLVNLYPISVVTASQNPAGAQEWIDFVLSTDGQQVLADAGFVAR